jgi:uncharacterized protein (DUF58 family)
MLAPVIRLWEDRFTTRGRVVFLATAAASLVGADTRRTQVFRLFAVGAALLVIAWILARLQGRPSMVEALMPSRATTLCPFTVAVRVTADRPLSDLVLRPPRLIEGGDMLVITPAETFVSASPGKPAEAVISVLPLKRGRHLLRGAHVRPVDPFRLVTGWAQRSADQSLIVYPRFYTMEEVPVPMGRRHQPGGIPLSSMTGDALEFVGTRDYRAGDPMRAMHWRSFARRGRPVVREFQDEYFTRIAIVLDTFLPRRPSADALAGFEAGISVVASIADHFSRSEYIVDILAAGPDLYEVSAGRSLAYLDTILDVLACLDPCHDTPFETIGPSLFDKLASTTSLAAVLLDWDETRLEFLRRVKTLGVAVWAIIVRDSPTTLPWEPAAGDLDRVEQIGTAEIEAALRAAQGEAPRG